MAKKTTKVLDYVVSGLGSRTQESESINVSEPKDENNEFHHPQGWSFTNTKEEDCFWGFNPGDKLKVTIEKVE